MDRSGGIQKKGVERGDGSDGKEKKRAHAGDFERQVEQIRKEAELVRANLDAAETALEEASQQRSNRHVQEPHALRVGKAAEQAYMPK
mmetsp:Transcript_11670/g.16876  ORF Transcript_11670/g.16876 Transcript_11670/m.16876 type:complete len:88 (+) Transcript_11670:258-521(+)